MTPSRVPPFALALALALALAACASKAPEAVGTEAPPPSMPKIVLRVDEPVPVPAGLDADKDGVGDSTDRCPDEAGSDGGCPLAVMHRLLETPAPLRFAHNSSALKGEAFQTVDAVARMMRHDPALVLEVQGHTEGVGPRTERAQLGEARAKAVVRALVAKGIEPKRLRAKGYGPRLPAKTSTTDEGRAANRRVDFRILDLPRR